jgi:DNA polymerase
MSKNPPAVPKDALPRHPLYVYKHRHLFIDVESFSIVNLTRCGAYRYWDDASAAIILLSYAYDDEPVVNFQTIKGQEPPAQFFKDLVDPNVVKHAFNANFERLAFNSHYGIYCDPEQWRCTMVLGTSLGLPAGMDNVSAVLDMEHKKGEGKPFIKYFCVPAKPTKKNGMRVRNLPEHDRMLWLDGIAYNKKDVEVERGLWQRLQKYDMQPRQWRAWAMDQRINDRGVAVDLGLIEQAIRINDIVKAELVEEAMELTGLKNPASVKQLLAWLNGAEAEEDERLKMHADEHLSPSEIAWKEQKLENLKKKTVIELLGSEGLDAKTRRVLELRQLMSKSSVTKYRAMQRSVCKDGRIRGLLQFYGAPRTGRWAGRIVQVQNLPQNHIKDLEYIRSFVKAGNLKMLKIMFGEGILQVLSELIRTAFIPGNGKRFIIVDFSAIEARLAAWDAQEKWRLEVFETHGMIYEASASMMFKVPIEDIVKGGSREDLRPKGKITELALGYQGGPNAIKVMGALEMGVEEEELLPMVKLWRQTSPAVVRNWYKTNDDAIAAVRYEKPIERARYGFEFESGTLFQNLPSGRRLAYPGARLEIDKTYGREGVVFDGMNQYTHQWGDIRTYGGKLFENRTQANGVDNLTNAMFNLEKHVPGDIVFSVHDEPVLEVDIDWEAELYAPDHEKKSERKKSRGVKLVESIMCWEQEGFHGLPLAADGMDAMVYQK